MSVSRPTPRLKPRGGCDALPARAELVVCVSPSLTGGDSRVGLEALLGGDPYSRRLVRPGRAMPHRLHPVLVELADFRPCFTWQCPRSFCRAAPPNPGLSRAAGATPYLRVQTPLARVSPPITGGDSRVGLEAMLVECNCAGARNVLSWSPSRTGTLRGHGA